MRLHACDIVYQYSCLVFMAAVCLLICLFDLELPYDFDIIRPFGK